MRDATMCENLSKRAASPDGAASRQRPRLEAAGSGQVAHSADTADCTEMTAEAALEAAEAEGLLLVRAANATGFRHVRPTTGFRHVRPTPGATYRVGYPR